MAAASQPASCLELEMTVAVEGKEGAVGLTAGAYAPQGRYLLAGDSAGEVHLCNLVDGLHVAALPHAAKAVKALALTADGARFAAGSGDKALAVWDIESGAPVRRWDRLPGVPAGVALNGPGSVLFAGSLSSVLVYDVRSGVRTPLQVLKGPTDRVVDIVFDESHAPDPLPAPVIRAASLDGSVCSWELRSGRLVVDELGEGGLASLDVSVDGQMLLVRTLSGHIGSYAAASGEAAMCYAERGMREDQLRTNAVLAGRGTTVVAGDADGGLRVRPRTTR
ncbi:Wd-repeat protein [Thecamonas trahens ATCC 50062]|uniref:Wd-repeat protein n=1 Tax=Thecamonas trahens ATCC 50062 TaxID=461836 RepID=A0A0L0D2J0_THETB|nr:Wd-repeat protein [Thecamonas trahens ATCC 50062]KNC46406.1 Wd-repeat protein [Thecamonas trahens ATCC 50062]|eukprot:XP_013760699.1 Wd-repeat protein [Thecamonas trahens ATCC 50062]